MINSFSARLLLALGFSCLALVAGQARAAGTASYYLAIAEDNDVAHLSAKAATGSQAAVDMLKMAEMYAMWKTQQELLAFRDYPYFEITNTSTDPTAGISRFRIAIDPARPFNFDTVFHIQSSPGITYAINGLDTVQGGVRSDYIDLTFTGFTADKFFRFRSDIDNDAGNVNFFTDYRSVLTDASGMSAASNALVSVNMSTGANFSDRIGGNQLGPGMPFITGTNFQNYHGNDMVQPYVVGNAAEPTVIPEPTSWLAVGSLLSVGGLFYRRRRLTKIN